MGANGEMDGGESASPGQGAWPSGRRWRRQRNELGSQNDPTVQSHLPRPGLFTSELLLEEEINLIFFKSHSVLETFCYSSLASTAVLDLASENQSQTLCHGEIQINYIC